MSKSSKSSKKLNIPDFSKELMFTLFGDNEMNDQWTEQEIKSFKDLQPKNDDGFKWTKEYEGRLLLNVFGYDFTGIDKYINLLFVRNALSKDLNRYVSTHTIEDYITKHFEMSKNFIEVIPPELPKTPFNLPNEFKTYFSQNAERIEKEIQDRKRDKCLNSDYLNASTSSFISNDSNIGCDEDNVSTDNTNDTTK